MWPFSGSMQGLWLALYLLTLALHAVFVSYVLIGSCYALVQALRRRGTEGRDDDPLAEQIRDRLPFMLGCGITAGVAPLLFLQLLYQRHFYSANLVMGPRWGAVVPALIAGFYALYVAKASTRWRRPALAASVVCFLFVAWSWTEIHSLMNDEPAWTAMYAAGDRRYAEASVFPRLAMWLGVMTALFAVVAAWTARVEDRKRLALFGIGGHVLAGAAGALLAQSGVADTHGWLVLLGAAGLAGLAGWVLVLRGGGLYFVTAAGTAALVAGAVVREAPRIAMLEPVRTAAAEAAGLPVFLATLIGGVLAISWIVRTIR